MRDTPVPPDRIFLRPLAWRTVNGTVYTWHQHASEGVEYVRADPKPKGARTPWS